jgi:hypothetical protein
MGHSRSSGGAGLQARIAPAQASSIIHAYLGRLPYFSLHQVPVEGHVPQSGVEHHGRTSRADTLDVQTIAAYIDEPPWGWICLGLALGGNRLVGGPDGRQVHDQGEYHRYPATYASQHPPAQGPRSNRDVCLASCISRIRHYCYGELQLCVPVCNPACGPFRKSRSLALVIRDGN